MEEEESGSEQWQCSSPYHQVERRCVVLHPKLIRPVRPEKVKQALQALSDVHIVQHLVTPPLGEGLARVVPDEHLEARVLGNDGLEEDLVGFTGVKHILLENRGVGWQGHTHRV